MVALEIKPKDQRVQELLTGIQDHLSDMRPAFGLIGEIVLSSIQRNFEAGGRPRKWKPLSPVTIAQRQREGKWPGQILVRQGVAGGLMGGLNYRPHKDRVEVSDNKEYAALHQFGARKGQFGTVDARVRAHLRRLKSGKTVKVRAHTRQTALPWGDIPARPFLMVQDEDWEAIREAMADFLTGG